MKNFLSYKTISRLHIYAFLDWALLAFLIEIINQLQLIYNMPDNYILGYGQLRPVAGLAIIFGAGLNLLFAHGYRIVAQIEKKELQVPGLGAAALLLLNGSLISGILAIWMRFNSGREYAEIPFLFANGLLIAQVLFLIAFIIPVWKSQPLSLPSTSVVLIAAGSIATYFLGHLGAPLHPLVTVSFFQGVQDAGLQEFYRAALLAFFIILPAFSFFFVWQKPEGSSIEKKAIQAILLFIMLGGALAGWSGLVHSTASPIIQTTGSTGGLFFGIAILGSGAILWKLSASTEGGLFKQLQKFVSCLLFIAGLFYAINSLRSGAALLQYTWLNLKDLTSLALLILIPAGLAFIARSGLAEKKMALPVNLLLWGLGISFLASLSQGLIQGFAAEGKNWIDVVFQGQLLVDESSTASLARRYWYSFKSIFFLGRALSLTGMLLLIWPVFKALQNQGQKNAGGEYLLVEEDR